MHLLNAINEEDSSAVRSIIEDGYDINLAYEHGQTALHLAASIGNTDIIRLLIENGANVNAKNNYKWTSLHKASFNGHTEIVKLLIENGADVNVNSNTHWTPLHLAADNGHTEIVRLLIENGANVNVSSKTQWSPLHKAVDNGHTEIVRLLIENGANVNAKNESSNTPLHLAASNGNAETVRLLLANGADVNAYNYSVKTPLDLARESRNADAMQMLQAYEKPSQKRIMDKLPDIDKNIPTTNTINPHAVAVVIGNKEYENNDIYPVNFAINDAVTLVKYLINVFGYKKENIIFVPNAKRSEFEAIFGTSSNYKGKVYHYLKKGISDLFIYYAGHGVPDPNDKETYFVPSDADPSAFRLTGYPLKQLYLNVRMIAKEKMPPNVFIMIDAGFSGATEKGMLLKNMSPVYIDMKNPLIILPNAVIMTSSKGTEISSWFPEKGHSMFTYFFLKAIKEIFERGKPTITVGDVFKHVINESEGVPYYAGRLHGRIQTPQIMGDKRKVLISR
jgi:ankyrin repeat protein